MEIGEQATVAIYINIMEFALISIAWKTTTNDEGGRMENKSLRNTLIHNELTAHSLAATGFRICVLAMAWTQSAGEWRYGKELTANQLINLPFFF